MDSVHIIGAGPAGSAAAIAARSAGRPVLLFEKSRVPRHQVCGEFLSPEISTVLDQLGLWQDFLRAGPAPIHRLVLHFGTRTLRSKIPGCAFGLSRYRLDRLLLDQAVALKATVKRALSPSPAALREAAAGPVVLAGGRYAIAPPGDRLFGFKAHFQGPGDDAVELFFFSGGYVGVSPVEGGTTNVCGIAPEQVLRAHHFQIDSLLRSSDPLTERLRPLSRSMKWLVTGPLVFGRRTDSSLGDFVYPAGDALGFIDPFTGSGILNALTTGWMAGLAAARENPSPLYLQQCRRALARPFQVAALFRAALRKGWADHLAPLVPVHMLFRLTRPVRTAP